MRTGNVLAERFELDALAGSGAIGEVYRATDRTSGETVAVKIVRGASTTARALSRFGREAEVLAQLDHPAVVRYVAHGTEGEASYLAMEWLDGEDLESRLSRGSLGVRETVALGQRIAGALGAAHQIGVVHRDVKPANVFLPGADAGRAKLVDLGVARVARAVRLTQTGTVLGTPAYMAPEQASGDRDVDARADVFALGALLHECLTGDPLFAAEHVVAVLAKVLLEEAPRLLDVPDALAELVERMLEKERDERPADGAQVVLSLRALGPLAEAGQRETRNPRPPSLTAEEQLLHCVVLGRPGETDLGRLRVVASRREAELVRLADGSLLCTWKGGGGDLARQAARAGRLALALSEAAPMLPLALATGRAPAGVRVSVGALVERAAAELGGAAVALDEASATLLEERFELVREGPRVLLGAERRAVPAARTLLGKPTPCVGRERELAALEAFMDECIREPMGRPVLLTAEAGVGKSRVRHELLSRLPESVHVWIGRGDPVSAGSSLGLVARALERASGAYAGLPLDERRSKLHAFATRHMPGAEGERTAEMLGEMLGAPFDASSSVPLRAARADAQVMADAMRRAFEELVMSYSSAGPLVLVLEDLQWGDASSVSYVDSALRVLGARPWLVLAFGRPEVHGLFPSLWSEREVQELRLAPLRERASRELVNAVLDAPTGPVVDRIVTRAAGNAFALEELLRAEAEGRSENIPDTVLGLAEARLTQLEPDARRVLRAASVFGETFWEEGVRVLVGESIEPTEWLDVLAARELVTPRAESRFGGARELVFRHALMREAAYATLTDADRTLGHRLAAGWLASRGEREALVVAEHWEQGGERAEAATAFLAAAHQAFEGDDFGAAIDRAERGITCGASGALAGALRLAQVEAHGWRGEHSASAERATIALDALDLGESAWWRGAEWLGRAYLRQGARAELLALCERLLVAPLAGAETAAVRTLVFAGVGLVYIGLPERAEPVVARARAVGAPLAARQPLVAGALASMRAVYALRAGDTAGYLEGRVAVQARYDEAGARRRACAARVNLGYALHELGADERAEEVLRHALADAGRMGLAAVRAPALNNLGPVLGRLGRLTEGCDAEREAVRLVEAQGDRRVEGASRTYLADMLRLLGKNDEARDEASRSVELLEGAAPPLLPYALAVLARIELARGELASARAAAERARGLLDSSGADLGEGAIRLAHIEALDAAGEVEPARDACRASTAWLRERAARISDAALREGFLERIPEHARTLELARDWGVEPADAP